MSLVDRRCSCRSHDPPCQRESQSSIVAWTTEIFSERDLFGSFVSILQTSYFILVEEIINLFQSSSNRYSKYITSTSNLSIHQNKTDHGSSNDAQRSEESVRAIEGLHDCRGGYGRHRSHQALATARCHDKSIFDLQSRSDAAIRSSHWWCRPVQ